MADREVRYCTSADGTRIAYTSYGEGPPLLVCPSVFESFGNDGEETLRYRPLWQGRSVIRYDFRGVGLSERDPKDPSVDRMVEDIEAVADSARVNRFVLQGGALSTAAALLYVVRHPDRVIRLILARPVTRSSDVMARENLDALIGLIRSNWEMASQAISDLGIRGAEPTTGIRVATMLRQNVEPQAIVPLLTRLYETLNVRDRLKAITCPTLVVHRKEDTLFPFAAAQHAAASIPNARLVHLTGSGPIPVGADAETGVEAMRAFLDEDPETRALPTAPPSQSQTHSAFRTVLFTDLVGHTEMMQRLGDDAGRTVLREHERITRETLAAHGGTEVKTMGDGFMASFGSVTRAVECATALQRAFAEREGEPLSVRVGLNAGEPIEEDGDLFGATVILASRIAARAEGGEILVSDNVRSLCAGKGFLFADRGEFVAKGFEEPVRIYEVNWRT